MKRPHVIVLMADQLRRDTLGCYGGVEDVSPNLDDLARHSAVFRSHTINCPLCVPSRNSMITGTWPHVNGAIVNGWTAEEVPYGTCREVPTLYEVLAEGGYRVEHVGVDHLRCDPPVADRHERIRFFAHPHEHGAWLRERGMAVNLSTMRSPSIDYSAGRPVVANYSNPHTAPWPHKPEDFLDWWLADRVIERIDQADPDEPLALLGNFWLPHPPYVVPEPYFSMYDPESLTLPASVGVRYGGESPMHLLHLPGQLGASITAEGWRKLWGVYLGMVRMMDDCVGRVIDALKRKGIWDDALVIFTSDHGEMLGSHRLFQKMCMYEESIRVAMMVKPPGGKTRGPRDQLTQHLDLAATICDYAGLEVMPTNQGRSFRGVVESLQAAGREEVFAEYNGNSGRSFQQRMIVTPTHKYIYNHDYEPELYDLTADPMETDNLMTADVPPAEGAQLCDRLQQWMVETNDVITMSE